MRICSWTLFCLCWLNPVSAQLDLPFVDVEPETAPIVVDDADEQERIREITRQIKARSQNRPSEVDLKPHPGFERFAKVLSRLQDTPSWVRIRVTLDDGSVVLGRVENTLFNVKTEWGIFPIQWSEVRRLKVEESTATLLHLHEKDVLSGDVLLTVLQIERDDASFMHVPFKKVRELLQK